MTDLVIRPLADDETSALFHTLSDPGLVGRALLSPPYDRFETVAAGGEYRPDWTWLALRGDTVVARVAYWGAETDERPKALDWFDFTDREAAVALLKATPFDAEYELILPPDWRENPATLAAAEARIEAATDAGYQTLTERFRYVWTPENGLPERPRRLEFRPEPDDAVLFDVLRRVHSDTRDHHALRAIERHGPDGAAQSEMDFIDWLPSGRAALRLAYTPEGELVGIQIPGHNPAGPCVGLIGVVPEQRGHSYGYDLLAECTHTLVAEGAQRIAAATDVGNSAMAASFARAGYPIAQHRYCMTAD
ncbi:GNAT family N-acetyltransferase [Streptomyces profundus]|uniref:GNAT family N-acetyltransferase n=1 Tax=Streptomyces profundus TaxID=2867410 RepID=UPI001D1616E3|nr:GNAT family N-acetyltransferase [Streptomyces sp. MA3_2.13]UED87084.1 GNAT family N-acetyltransferase [Streptomyces sp. MA3_2.13]